MEENKNTNHTKIMLAGKKNTSKCQAEQLGADTVTISQWLTNSPYSDLGNLMKIAKMQKIQE